MDISLPASLGGGRAESATADVAGHTAARIGAWSVLLGTAITTAGLSWDIQWHVEVGPDTFFTLSHLALYSGSALAGIASLVMVLLSTAAQRAGHPWPATVGGSPVRVFGGTFTAPLGYLISGVGAASFLLYGLLDLWWHSIYGFDAVLNTPSHVALFLSICLTMVGSIIVFSAVRDQRWGKAGLIVAVPILITFAPIPFNALSDVPLPIDPTLLGIVLCAPMLLIMGALVVGRGGAVGIAVVLGVMQALLWWFSPWAATAYASAVGLPMRDGLTPQPPQLPGAIPMFLIVAAVVVEGALWLCHARGVRFGRIMVPLGALAGLIVGLTIPLQLSLTDPTTQVTTSMVLIVAVLGLVLGVLAGYLGARFAALLRSAATSEAD